MGLLERISGIGLNTNPNAPTGPTVDNVIPLGLAPRMPPLETDFVKNVVKRRDSRAEQSRLSRPGYTHVSSLIGVCTRQHALAKRFAVDISESVTGGHRVMWKIGRAVEQHVRDEFIEGMEHRGIYGRWVCACKRIDHEGFTPARPCRACGTEARRYREPVLTDDVNGIIGSPDLTFTIGGNFFVPVELKSMAKDQWDKLTAPLPDHVAQVVMYRYLYSVRRYRVHDKVVIIYVTKDFKWGDPYKEFHVDARSEQVQELVQEMVAAARAIKVAGDTNTLPPRAVCHSSGNPRAKSCPVAHFCFSMGE